MSVSVPCARGAVWPRAAAGGASVCVEGAGWTAGRRVAGSRPGRRGGGGAGRGVGGVGGRGESL